MAKIVCFALLAVCTLQAAALPRLQADDVKQQVGDIVKRAAQQVSDLVDKAVYQVERDLQDAGYGFGMQIFQIDEVVGLQNIFHDDIPAELAGALTATDNIVTKAQKRYSNAIGNANNCTTFYLKAASDSIDALKDDASSAAAKTLLSSIASAVSSAAAQIKPLYDGVLANGAPATKTAVNQIVSTNGSYHGADVKATVQGLAGQVLPQIDSLRQAAKDVINDAVDDFLGL
ncbi:hypothetical protein ONE63_011286 [Megalurothrips usitatus]|uniref:Uncharacterized protein n=1 Tax=Megalurothrips usitatus TaxID=439358 RepID=A0AAV7WZJ5_9NEOP|nr:hypothetical protein ONE63_011286 [Megalurothrips usitatus]